MSIFGSKKSRIVKSWMLFVCCLCLLTLPVFAGDTADVWDGTVAKPTKLVEKDGNYYYEISTCEQLAFVAQNGGDWLTYNYLLVNDLILNETTPEWDEEGNCTNSVSLRKWTPIGETFDDFVGIFDGEGHVVSGLYVNVTDSNEAGLFGCADTQSIIRDLSVKNAYVKGGIEVGGLVGYTSGNITNCSFDGMVIGNNRVGGLVGSSSALNGIIDCFVNGDVIATNGCAGGLVGNNGNIITTSYASVNVIAINGPAGGLVGKDYNEITLSWAEGNVTAINGSAGGLIGAFESTSYCVIQNCYALGNVSATEYGGGLIGRYSNTWTSTFQFPNGIFNCYSTGAVLSGESRGGFLGEDRRIWGEKFSIENCYFLRDVGINEDLFGTSIATADAANEVEGKTLAQMQQQNTFTGWDFGTVWYIDPDKNEGLPYLWLRDGEEDIVPLPEYSISGIQPRDASGKKLNKLPKDDFLVTISLKKLVEDSDALVLLACYTDDGQYQGLLYVSVKGMSKNAELELTLPVSNQTGKIKKLTAFTVASFGDMTPLGEAVTFE